MPSLGSDKDVILRQFVEREMMKEALHLRIMVSSNVGISNENRSQFMGDYRKYISLLFMQDMDVAEEENAMHKQLDEILATQPKLIKNKDGSLSVRDLFRKVNTEGKKRK